MCMRKRNILLSVGSLSSGGLLYIFLRKGSWIARRFPVVSWLTEYRAFLERQPLGFFRYYFPDFLWGLSLGCALVAVLGWSNKNVWLCSFVSFGCGCLWEALQWIKWVSGTGDVLDVAMYFLAAIMCIILNKRSA